MCLDVLHDGAPPTASIAIKGVENPLMDPDLFTPQDAAALFSIRAANAQGVMSLTELLAAFATEGLLCETPTSPAHVECGSPQYKPPKLRNAPL